MNESTNILESPELKLEIVRRFKAPGTGFSTRLPRWRR